MENKIRVLFLGTGIFAVPVLEGLLQAPGIEVVGVVTQPDKPAGRGRKLTPGVLKEYLMSLDNPAQLTVFQSEKLKLEAEAILEQTQPDIVIVAAYGQMVPEVMLEQPKYKALNLHGSLLPQLRGAVPVHMAILQGLEQTGVSIQRVVKELDAGPVLAATVTDIYPVDTTGTLMLRLAEMGRDLLLELLPGWVEGSLEAEEQDHTQATFCREGDIAKEKAEITFDTPIAMAERMVRAFNPDPIAWFTILHNGEQKRVRVFEADIAETELDQESSKIQELAVIRHGKQLFLTLADGLLELKELQLESKERRFAEDYLFLGR